ncbi:Zinc finger, ZZ type [Nesidiocoris tenuis]|uniref:Zinc finger, ZZ type n=1 Tax=Nesidiocoris tenuis TaxID=355587 RepID=A0ABN7A996_9HEMI|nr:Zinc finger, ZZ type [Nesidiocoris tenuis]
MASPDAVQFKVTLRKNGEPVEIRRFAIDKDVVTNFSYLRQKLYSVFPVLQNTGMNVSWKDNEGDTVSIGSDDELIIALTEMELGQLKKLDVSIVSQAGDGGAGRPNRDRSVHPGVTCDGCESPVTGYRYKCVNCADYDLCSSCEQKGIHSEHVVVRYPSPMSHDHHLLKRLNKLCKRYRVSAPEYMVYGGSAPRRGCPVSSDVVTDVIEDFLTTIQSHAEVITPEMLQQIISNLSNLNLNAAGGSGDDQQAAGAAAGPSAGDACWGRRPDGHRRKCGDGFSAGKHPDETPSKKKDKRRKSGETVGASATASASASASVSPPQFDVYGLVSHLVRAAPGIVSQLTNMPNFNAAAGNSGTGANAPTASGQPTPSAPASSSPQAQPSSNSAETTAMNVDEEAAPTSQQSSQSPAPQAEPRVDQSNSGSSDDLKKELDQPSLSPEQLDRALRSMINMGFNNEGGWLRDLLVAKGGDITKVLDHLITSSKTTNPPIELD